MSIEDDELYLLDGVEVENGTLVLSCGSAVEPGGMQSVIQFKNNDTWTNFVVSFDTIVSIASIGCTCYALGEDGSVLRFEEPDYDGSFSKSVIGSPAIERLDSFAELMRIRSVGAGLVSAGMDGQLFEFDGRNWAKKIIDIPGIDQFDIQDIAGPSLMDYYLVGMGGWIVHWQGTWSRVSSPSNSNFSSACLGDDGFIYVGGDNGVLVRGKEDQWDVLAELDYGNDIWSITSYRGSIYAATSREIFEYRENEWRLLELPDFVSAPFHRLYSLDGKLWSVGEIGVACFDGIVWRSVSVPKIIEQ